MKVTLLSTLLLAGVARYANAQTGVITGTDTFEDCVDCLEDIDDARDCLRECNDEDFINESGEVDGSLLENCLDPSRSSSVESIDELVECCGFDSDDCEDDLEDVQDCLNGCIDSCISDFAEDYLDCIQDEAGDDDCDLGDCIDGFLSDSLEDELDLSLSGSNDLFSTRAIERRIERIEEEDLEDCELLADFVDSTCDVGTDCCDSCEEELGLFVDCLVNDIVIPFVSLELNKTILTCPIDTEECELDSRSRSSGSRKERKKERKERRERKLESKPLSEKDEKLFTRALSLPKETSARREARKAARKEKKEGQTQRNPRKEAIVAEIIGGNRRLEKLNTTELLAACEKQMRMNIVAHNVTYAMNVHMECVAVAAIQTLEANTPEEESAAPVFSAVAALVAALVGTAVAFF